MREPGKNRARRRVLTALAATAVLAAVVPTAVLAAGPARAAATGTSSSAPTGSTPGATVGPFEISMLGYPELCWEASGNGAPITLERCEAGLQNEVWSLTGDGVLMNGIGYCMESLPGEPAGTSLYIDFADQCGGDRGQVWRYDGSTGQLSGTGACAGLGGPPVPGTPVVRARCPAASSQASSAPRWSLGDSAVSLAAGHSGGPAGGTYRAGVTVTDAASADAAYGVAVRFTLPRTLTAAGLRAPSGWSCDVASLTCTGSLAAGASGQLAVTGRWPSAARAGDAYTVAARVSVSGTTPRSGRRRTTVPVPVTVAAPAAVPAAGRPGGIPAAMILVAVLAAALLLGGGVLVWMTRGQPRSAH